MRSFLTFSIALATAVGTLVIFGAATYGEGLPNDGKPLYFLGGGFALVTLFSTVLGIKVFIYVAVIVGSLF